MSFFLLPLAVILSKNCYCKTYLLIAITVLLNIFMCQILTLKGTENCGKHFVENILVIFLRLFQYEYHFLIYVVLEKKISFVFLILILLHYVKQKMIYGQDYFQTCAWSMVCDYVTWVCRHFVLRWLSKFLWLSTHKHSTQSKKPQNRFQGI